MNDEAAKEPKKSKNDGQNRCRRCDRPLSNPNANYGWWCAQIVGANKYNEIVSMLDENAMEMYNRYIGYENKLLPNNSYELYKQNKTYWMNETGISRGVEL